tara:strand:- start:2082 stop:3092 length:1011 start_codon:yes stop_codon:yes gene_type:complete
LSSVLYITSDRTGAGKTTLCTAIAHKLINLGKTVSVFKPLSAETNNGQDERGTYKDLVNLATSKWPIAVPEKGIDAHIIKEICVTADQVKGSNDILIVEGLPTISIEDTNRIIEALDATLLSVVEYSSELSPSNLEGWSKIDSDRFVGIVINKMTIYASTDLNHNVLIDLQKRKMPVLGVIPENRTLLGVSVKQLADYLGGKLIDFGNDSGNLVESVMVGGMWMDAGEVHFGLRNDKAVIVRGDRPDIQMAALGTSTSCLVLTGDIEPIEYILNEARESETPIITVATDTLSTMENISELPRTAVFDHSKKLREFSLLLDNHVELESIYQKLGAIT